jgi:hypothetical protein
MGRRTKRHVREKMSVVGENSHKMMAESKGGLCVKGWADDEGGYCGDTFQNYTFLSLLF